MTAVVRRTPPVSGTLTSSEWLAWVRASLLNGSGQSAEQRQLTLAADREPIRLIYGEDRVGAQVLNVVPSGVNVLIQCLWALAGDSVNDILFGNEPLPAGATVTHYTGSQTSVDSALAAAFATHGITYTDTLAGYMYSVITMPQSAVTGSLDLTARIRGRRLYDPRKDSTVSGGSGAHRLADPATWEYATCPALADADYLYSPAYGCGKAVDWVSVITAANINDALVGGEKRRILDGLTIPGMQPVKNVAETLRTYAGCFHRPGPYGIQLVPDRPASSVAVYSHAAGHIAGLQRLEKRDTGELPTAVEVLYTDRSMEPWRDASALAELSGAGVTIPYRLQQVRLPGIQRHSQAKREATERLNKLNTTDLAMVLDVFDIGIAHEMVDVITVADHPVGLSNKEFRIADAPEAIGPGLWRLPCLEYDPATYSDSVVSGPTYPDTGLASPAVAPPTLSAFSVSVLADGTRRFAITAPLGAARGSRIMVRYVSGSSSSWAAMSHLFSLDYDPNVADYTFETNQPAGSGTWSFGAKLVTVFGVEAVTASLITGVELGREPVSYGTAANLLQNADWTDDLGYPLAFYSDTRSLRAWQPGGYAASFMRNYDNGHQYNFGRGGCCIYIPSNTVGHYAYAYQEVPFDGANYPDQEFECSVYVAAFRANVILYLRFYDASHALITGGDFTDSYNTGSGSYGDPQSGVIENNYKRLWVKGSLVGNANKTNARYVVCLIIVECTASSSPYPFSAWHKAMLCRAPAGVTRATATLWNDSSPSTIHGGQIPVGTVTDVAETTPTDGNQTETNSGGFPSKRTITVAELYWTNNTPEAVRVVVSFSGLFQYVINAGSISSADISFQTFDGTTTEEVSTLKLSSLGASIYHQVSGISRIISVGTGITLRLRVYFNFFGLSSGGGQATAYWSAVRVNLQGIRK